MPFAHLLGGLQARARSSLGAWAHCSRGRLDASRCSRLRLRVGRGALHGHVGLSRLGWEVTEDFMKESEKLYDQMDDAGVTKLEVTAATTAAPEPLRKTTARRTIGGQQGIQQGDLQGDQQVNQQGGQQGEEGQQGQKEQYSQQWQQGAQWQQERQWQRTPEQVPQDGTWVNMAAPVQVGQTSQPRERLTTPNAKTTKTIHFNPCQDAESQKMQWTKGALADQCEVDAAKCEFCAWVLQYDSEYRVNDVVSLQGLNYKLTSQSLLTRPEYQGTILRRMLESKPKHPNSNEIMWHENDREEAQENFEFILDSVKNMDCGATGSDTLLVHLRAGDSVGTAFKEIPDTDAAARKVVEYAKRRPGIKRIEISGVLHFGVPDPDDAFYAANGGYNIVKDASGLPPIASQMTTCRKMVTSLTVFSRKLRRVEWRCGSRRATTRTRICADTPKLATMSAPIASGRTLPFPPRSEAHTQGTPSAICSMICTGTFASAMND